MLARDKKDNFYNFFCMGAYFLAFSCWELAPVTLPM
jgi:hypothetical protein